MCGTCSLDVVDSLRLGSADDPEIPQRVPNYLLRDNRGTHYLVFNGWVNKPILRYDSAGRFVGKLGAYGSGPGEYTMTGEAMLGPSDSVMVLDFGNRKGRVYTSEGKYARDLALSQKRIFGFTPSPGGQMVAWAFSDRPPLASSGSQDSVVGVRQFVSRIGADGMAADSFPVFGVIASTAHPTMGAVQWRIDARPHVAPDGSIWTLLSSGYRVEQHAPNGATMKVIGVELPDLPPPLMTQGDADSLFSRARVVTTAGPGVRVSRGRISLQVDGGGLLWVTRVVSAPRADTIVVRKDYLSPDEAPGHATVPRNTEDRLYHTIIEVIDPHRGRILARTELPFLGVPVRPGYVGRVRVDEMDQYVVHVYMLSLTR
jgi:hypothetical protein